MSNPKILVTGPSGNIGCELVDCLVEKKVPFRAAFHKEEQCQKLKNKENVEICLVEYEDKQTLLNAMQGIERAFFLTPPGRNDYFYPMIDAAQESGIRHIVKLSALGAEEKSSEFNWAKEHRNAEEYAKQKGIGLTALRPSAYFSNVFLDVESIKNEKKIYHPTEDAKINYISNCDVGEIAAIILSEGDKHIGKDYNLTGRESFSSKELAKLYSEVLGTEIEYVPIKEDQLRERCPNMNEQQFKNFVNMIQYFKHGGYDKFYEDAEKLLGKQTQSLRDYIQQNINQFKPSA